MIPITLPAAGQTVEIEVVVENSANQNFNPWHPDGWYGAYNFPSRCYGQNYWYVDVNMPTLLTVDPYSVELGCGEG